MIDKILLLLLGLAIGFFLGFLICAVLTMSRIADADSNASTHNNPHQTETRKER